MLSWHPRTNTLEIKIKKNHFTNGSGGEKGLYSIYEKVIEETELGSSQWYMMGG